jgi:hypothetical protein
MPDQKINVSLILGIVFVFIVFVGGGVFYFTRQNAPTTPNTNNPGSFGQAPINTPTSVVVNPPLDVPTQPASATATIDPHSLVSKSNLPTITGVFAGTTGLEVLITKNSLPTQNLLSEDIPDVVWDDYSDHGGGVILYNTPAGTFSNTITSPLVDGTYTVGIYIVTYHYPRNDENMAKDYRRLLTSGTLTIAPQPN